MKFVQIKKKILKSVLIFSLSLSLFSGPVAGNEVSKLLECLTGEKAAKMQELEKEGLETGDTKKNQIKK